MKRWKWMTIPLLLTLMAWRTAGAQFNASMFADHRAREVGDVITILVMEYASASSAASTSTRKDNQLGLLAKGGMQTQAYQPYWGGSGNLESGFEGDGAVTRQGKLRTQITASIIETMGNGNLLIQASRMVEVNGEKEFTTITGTIRPQDISGGNTVYSYQIADAQITYKGKGVIQNGQKPGFLMKVFNWVF